MAESHSSDRGPGVLVHNPHIRFMVLGPLTLKVVRPPSRLVFDQGLPNAPLTDNEMDRVDHMGEGGRKPLRVVKYIGQENDVIHQSVSVHDDSLNGGQLFNP